MDGTTRVEEAAAVTAGGQEQRQIPAPPAHKRIPIGNPFRGVLNRPAPSGGQAANDGQAAAQRPQRIAANPSLDEHLANAFRSDRWLVAVFSVENDIMFGHAHQRNFPRGDFEPSVAMYSELIDKLIADMPGEPAGIDVQHAPPPLEERGEKPEKGLPDDGKPSGDAPVGLQSDVMAG